MNRNRTLEKIHTNLREAAKRITMGDYLALAMDANPPARDLNKVGNELAFVNCNIFDEFSNEIKEDMKLLVKNAKIQGLHDRSVIEEGRLADLILVDGNPLIDREALTRVSLVMKGGVLLKAMEDASQRPEGIHLAG